MPSNVIAISLAVFPGGWKGLLGAVIVAFVARLLWRIQQSPHRPFMACLLDTVFDLPAILKLGPWGMKPTVSNALRIAKKRTKLGGDQNIDEGLVVKSDLVYNKGFLASKARFSPAGQLFFLEGAVGRMVDRLRFKEFLRNHPDVEKTTMKPPVFVIGFPRTGTTFLHELLGLHEGVRMHYSWEQLSLVPTTDKEDLESLEADRRKRYNDKKFVFNFIFKQMVGDRLQHIHRIAYDEPEECTIPCAMELPWGLTQLPFMVYTAEELFPLGAGAAYTQYRKALQLLTWQAKDRRSADFTWALKCPFHLPYLSELFEAFPGATVVWTHRDPAECIASACSLYETIMHMTMEESSVDRVSIGKAVLKYSKLSLEAAERSIAQLGNKVKMMHVRYMDTVKDPKQLCRQVYEKVFLRFCLLWFSLM